MRPEDVPEYMVSIGNEEQGHFCGGTLIAPRTVLSAAHCFSNVTDNTWEPAEWVDFGRYDLTSGQDGINRVMVCQTEANEDDSCDPEEVAYVVLDPTWNEGTEFNNDFALIFLPQAIADRTPVQVNVDASIPAEDDELQAFGWGMTKYDEKYEKKVWPDRLMTAKVTYVPNDNCMATPYLWSPSQITPSMLCAYDDDKATCQGDSGMSSLIHHSILSLMSQQITLSLCLSLGGPVIMNSTNGPVQVGVFSFVEEGKSVQFTTHLLQVELLLRLHIREYRLPC